MILLVQLIATLWIVFSVSVVIFVVVLLFYAIWLRAIFRLIDWLGNVKLTQALEREIFEDARS